MLDSLVLVDGVATVDIEDAEHLVNLRHALIGQLNQILYKHK